MPEADPQGYVLRGGWSQPLGGFGFEELLEDLPAAEPEELASQVVHAVLPPEFLSQEGKSHAGWYPFHESGPPGALHGGGFVHHMVAQALLILQITDILGHDPAPVVGDPDEKRIGRALSAVG